MLTFTTSRLITGHNQKATFTNNRISDTRGTECRWCLITLNCSWTLANTTGTFIISKQSDGFCGQGLQNKAYWSEFFRLHNNGTHEAAVILTFDLWHPRWYISKTPKWVHPWVRVDISAKFDKNLSEHSWDMAIRRMAGLTLVHQTGRPPAQCSKTEKSYQIQIQFCHN